MKNDYGKLVRDKIPEVIEQNGEKAVIRILDDREYIEELLKKLIEEAKELLASQGDIRERADVGEVLYALDQAMGWTKKDIEAERELKNSQRGTFSQKIYLEDCHQTS